METTNEQWRHLVESLSITDPATLMPLLVLGSVTVWVGLIIAKRVRR